MRLIKSHLHIYGRGSGEKKLAGLTVEGREEEVGGGGGGGGRW